MNNRIEVIGIDHGDCDIIATSLRKPVNIRLSAAGPICFQDMVTDYLKQCQKENAINGPVGYPWFKAGIHDRVPLSLINGCICISDTSELLAETIPDNTGVVRYSLEDIEAMAVSIKELLGNQDKMQEIAEAGTRYALSHMTWSAWVRKFVAVL
jgi:hypothetical protein